MDMAEDFRIIMLLMLAENPVEAGFGVALCLHQSRS